ncbi:hypothetical protein GCM10023093_30480 [Nemorincola caseinilytica]|uniref:Tetratricopeptide repeat protein n=1 Tax=Nemorincola caseinilytica TaxID=2054315 RepID=A0ABP8NR93_9BACT
MEGKAFIDSLERALPLIKEDTNKLKALYVLSTNNNTIDPGKGIRFGEQLLEMATALGKKRSIIGGYIAIGINYQHRSDYPRALEHYNKAMMLCSENEYPELYGDIISHMAVILQEMGEYDKALDHQFRSLRLNERFRDSFNMGGDLGNIGIAYMLKKDYEKALEYDMRSLEIFKLINDKNGIAHNYGNIGNVYKEYGNYVLALEYDMRSLDLFRELEDYGGMAINQGNIGDVYLETVRAMDAGHTHKVLPKGTRQEFLARSIKHFEESIALSRQIEQLDNILEFSKALSEAYRLTGNYEKALENYQLHVLFRDSIHSDENRLKIAKLETGLQQGLKEKQIQITELERQNKRTERILYIASVCILLMVMAVITRKFMAQKQRNKLLAQERKKNLERIEKQKEVMSDIAYAHSHDVSGQVATILGLTDVFDLQNYAHPDNKIVIDGIAETARKLDIIVKDMIVKENMLNKDKKS